MPDLKTFEEQNEGVSSMSSVIERYAEQYAQQYHKEKVKEDDMEKAIKLLKRGISAEIIAEAMPSLSEEEILKLKDSLALQTAI